MIVKGKKFTVVGMGETGIETANFLARKGGYVVLLDRRPRAEIGTATDRLDISIETFWETEEIPLGTEHIILSPGVDVAAPFLAEAKRRKVEVIGEIELASRFNLAPIIAVTGSNGKTTTTTLIGKMLEADGKKVRVGGNIGTPFIKLVDEDGVLDYMVLEISSFQLETIKQLRPAIAAILNLTPDHLDRHKTFNRYVALKERIAINQTLDDSLILNADDPETVRMAVDLPVKKFFFSREREVEVGAWLDEKILRVRVPGNEYDIGSVEGLPLAARFQIENVLAAMALAGLAGISRAAVMKAVQGFVGLQHRMEWVCSVRGVDYINDSKGTNVGSVVKSLGDMDRPVILVFGGRDKGGDFLPLLPLFKTKVRRLILIGESRQRVKNILNGIPPFEEAESLEQAVRRAAETAQAGDVVLLSPGCASFDMFENYVDRGEKFKVLVGKII